MSKDVNIRYSDSDLAEFKKLINEKRVIYDYKVDQKEFKWSGKSTLKKIEFKSFARLYFKK